VSKYIVHTYTQTDTYTQYCRQGYRCSGQTHSPYLQTDRHTHSTADKDTGVVSKHIVHTYTQTDTHTDSTADKDTGVVSKYIVHAYTQTDTHTDSTADKDASVVSKYIVHTYRQTDIQTVLQTRMPV